MNLKYNRWLGALVLVLVIALSLFWGIRKGKLESARPEPDADAPNYGGTAEIFDSANLLSGSEEDLLEELCGGIPGSLWVFTTESIGNVYSDDYVADLIDDYNISEGSDLILLVVSEQDKYWFAYGEWYFDALDPVFDDLMRDFENAYYRGDYAAAILSVAQRTALEYSANTGHSASGSNVSAGLLPFGKTVSVYVFVIFLIVLVVLIISVSSSGRKRRRTGYYTPGYIPYLGIRRPRVGYRRPAPPPPPRPGFRPPAPPPRSHSGSFGSLFRGGGSFGSRSSSSSFRGGGSRGSSFRSSSSRSSFRSGGMRSGGMRGGGMRGGGKR